MRRKGEQRGSVRRRGQFWYIAFYEWRMDAEGNEFYGPTERRIDGSEKMGKRAAAAAGYDQHVAKVNGPAHIARSTATLAEFVNLRFRADHIELLKKTGKQFYENMLKNHLLPQLGDVKLTEITTPMIQRLVVSKRESHSPQTLRHIRNCLSAIFKHAKVLKYVSGDAPTVGVKLPELVETPRGALTTQQVESLIEAMPEQYRCLVRVLAETGLRIGEALGLRWAHVNLEDGWKIVGGYAIPPNSLYICENWVRNERTTLKTQKSRRMVPLTSGAFVALALARDAAQWRLEEHPVFANRNGKPFDGHNIAARFLKTAGENIGCPWVSWHCFRHTAATRADQFLTPSQKQALLGHATAKMSGRYTHAGHEDVRQGLEKAVVH